MSVVLLIAAIRRPLDLRGLEYPDTSYEYVERLRVFMAIFLPKCCDSTRVDEARKSFLVIQVSDGGSVS